MKKKTKQQWVKRAKHFFPLEDEREKYVCPECQATLIGQVFSTVGCMDGVMAYFQCECGCFSAWVAEHPIQNTAWYKTEQCQSCEGKSPNGCPNCKGWGRIQLEETRKTPESVLTH